MMIMNWFRNIDRSLVQFDFLLRSRENIYQSEIEALGGRVFYVSEYPNKYFQNKRETTEFFKNHINEYAGIHVHYNALLYVNVFRIARKYGVKLLIGHSHSTNTKNKLYTLIHKLNKRRIGRLATNYLACSKEAGEWAYNKGIDYQIVKNGIPLKKFEYNDDIRRQVRQELDLEDKFVIGHVGRFLDVKNHKFLIEIFQLIAQQREDARLILVGTGPLKDEIIQLVNAKKLQNKVLFLGVRKDVERLYSAMDAFVLPSKYEGVGIVLIEAQASNLPCYFSDCIPKSILYEELVHRIPLGEANCWGDAILNNISNNRNVRYNMANNEWDIRYCTQQLQNIYLNTK